jgi:Cu(I)/Ag(I) efflux system protein CusF
VQLTHILATTALAMTLTVNAQTMPPSGVGNAAQLSSSTAVRQSDGEVRKMNKEQGKMTLKHGPIANLEMPGMTMVFKVSDPKMLDSIKEGDKVKFAASKVNGAITVTSIEAVK